MSMEDLVGKSRLGQYLIFVTTEDVDIDVEIPSHKVEEGINIMDHVERKPKVVKLKGLLVRPTKERVERLIEALEKYETQGTLLSYEGRRIYRNMVLSKLQIKASVKVMNGFDFSCTLTEIDIATTSYVQSMPVAAYKSVTTSGQVQTANANTGQIYHVVKRGDTYWGLSKAYGSSVQQLRAWNKYADSKIPLGAKLRVK